MTRVYHANFFISFKTKQYNKLYFEAFGTGLMDEVKKIQMQE